MKKILAILISTLLVLTLFAACKANKPDNTLTPNPPTGTTESKETIETTESEVVPETEKKEEKPETTTEKVIVTQPPVSDPTKPVVTKAPETKPQQKPVNTTENRTNPPTVTQPVLDITYDEAKEIALGHAGLVETDIRHYKSELDRERNIIIYEIEFDSGKYEYEYEINADTGKVIKAEKEIRD